MSIVKEYRSNFHEAFQKDKGEVLTRLIAPLENKEAINKSLTEIVGLEREIKNTKLENSPSLNLEEKIKKARSKLDGLHGKKAIENKKADKLTSARTKLCNTLKSDLLGLGTDLHGR